MKGKRRFRDPWIKAALYLLLFLVVLSVSTARSQDLPRIPVYIKDREIRVEVARTEEDRARGLMERKSLGKNEGMLFIFDEEGYHGFWMKNTRLPLSIAFMTRKGKIVSITDMKPLDLSEHDPPQPILYALEVNKGWFAANGIKAGDVLRFSK